MKFEILNSNVSSHSLTLREIYEGCNYESGAVFTSDSLAGEYLIHVSCGDFIRVSTGSDGDACIMFISLENEDNRDMTIWGDTQVVPSNLKSKVVFY